MLSGRDGLTTRLGFEDVGVGLVESANAGGAAAASTTGGRVAATEVAAGDQIAAIGHPLNRRIGGGVTAG